MLFVKLDANWVNHHKIIQAGLDGRGLHATALCLAKLLETDGWLHRSLLYREGATDDLIDRLVALSLLEADGDLVRPWGWLSRNPSQGAIAAKRASKSEAGKRGNHTRHRHGGDFESCTVCNPPEDQGRSSQVAIAESRSATGCDRTPSPEPEPEPEPEPLTLIPSPPSPAPGFEDFWREYPRKTAKDAARRRWDQAIKKASPAEIIAGAKRYAAEVADTPTNYVKHPDGWLNAGRWADAPGANVRAVNGKPMALATAEQHGASGLVDPKEL